MSPGTIDPTLIASLCADHKRIRAVLLPLISNEINTLAYHYGDADPELARVVSELDTLCVDLEVHFTEEELFVLPLLEKLIKNGDLGDHDLSTLDQQVSQMQSRHEDFATLAAELRGHVGELRLPATAASLHAAVLDNLRELLAVLCHSDHVEQSRLFPSALACIRYHINVHRAQRAHGGVS